MMLKTMLLRLVALMPFLTPVLFLAVILGFIAVMRYLAYRERLAMLEKGAPLPSDPRSPAAAAFAERIEFERTAPLRSGITTALVGLAITLGLLTFGIGPWLLAGLIPAFVGVSWILGYVLTTGVRHGAGEGPGDGR